MWVGLAAQDRDVPVGAWCHGDDPYLLAREIATLSTLCTLTTVVIDDADERCVDEVVAWLRGTARAGLTLGLRVGHDLDVWVHRDGAWATRHVAATPAGATG